MHTTADKRNLHLHNNVKFFLAQIVYPFNSLVQRIYISTCLTAVVMF